MDTWARNDLESLAVALRRLGDALEALERGSEEFGWEEVWDQENRLRQTAARLPSEVGQRLTMWDDAIHGRDLHLMANWWRYLQEVEQLLLGIR